MGVCSPTPALYAYAFVRIYSALLTTGSCRGEQLLRELDVAYKV
jgi:hypothetical protein